MAVCRCESGQRALRRLALRACRRAAIASMSRRGSAWTLRCLIGVDFDRWPTLVEIDRRDRRGLHVSHLLRTARRQPDPGRRRIPNRPYGRHRVRMAIRQMLFARRLVGRSVKFLCRCGRAGRRIGRDGKLHRRLGGDLVGRIDRFGGGEKLVGAAQLGLPDRAAANAADLAAVRPQALRLDIVGCSAGRADDEHGRISSRSWARHPTV